MSAAGSSTPSSAPQGAVGALALGPGAAPAHAVFVRIGQWVASAMSVGVVLSVAIHIVLLLIAAVMSVGIARVGGAGSGSTRDYELTTSEAALTGVMDAPLEDESPSSVADSDLPDVPTAGIMEGSGGVDAPASGEGLGAIAEGVGGAGGGDIGEGDGLGAGGAGGGSARFFGVEAQGSRFAYIVDVSGSMHGEKLAALKRELSGSIGGLLEHMSYFVVCFASTPQPLADRRKWTDATEEGKKWAVVQIAQLKADGGTMPWGAFELVLTMRPPPDAIYFMTDGVFDPQVADTLAQRNRGAKKIPIHCITFVDDSAEELMRRIAAQSGGTYTHVRGSR